MALTEAQARQVVVTSTFLCCHLSGNQGQCNHYPGDPTFEGLVRQVAGFVGCDLAEARSLVETRERHFGKPGFYPRKEAP